MTNQTGYPSNYSNNQSADEQHTCGVSDCRGDENPDKFLGHDAVQFSSLMPIFRKKTAASVFRVGKE
jgi:hypothetical protein